jgi:hypothetical protein
MQLSESLSYRYLFILILILFVRTAHRNVVRPNIEVLLLQVAPLPDQLPGLAPLDGRVDLGHALAHLPLHARVDVVDLQVEVSNVPRFACSTRNKSKVINKGEDGASVGNCLEEMAKIWKSVFQDGRLQNRKGSKRLVLKLR